jgi:glycosyltransferase involved in cell wall biosynthesis
VKTSVALCTYNGGKYLSQQVESIFQQSHRVDEIIVCDDGSSDNTLAILDTFQKDYPLVLKIYKNEQNLGGRRNFEKCFNLCTGDVIFFCDQDDIWHSDKVQRMLEWFAGDKNCWGIATDARLIGENGEDLQRGFWESFTFCASDLKKMDITGLDDFVLRHHNVVAGAMLAVRKEAKPFITPFRFPSGIWHDEWITIVLSCMGKMKLMNDKLVAYRLHSGQQAGVGKDSADVIAWSKKIKTEKSLQADPDFYLSHAWYTYQKLQLLRNDLPGIELDGLDDSLHQRLQHAKRIFLNKHRYFLRKAKLFKWYLNGTFVTTWKDVVTM